MMVLYEINAIKTHSRLLLYTSRQNMIEKPNEYFGSPYLF